MASVTVAFLFVNKNDKGFPTIFDLPNIITFFLLSLKYFQAFYNT